MKKDIEENIKSDKTNTKNMNFEEAVEKAISFANRNGYPYAKLVKANKDKNDNWNVTVDVGVLKVEIKTIKVAFNGVISGFI